MPSWIDAGYQEYAKRLQGDVILGLVEIPVQGKGKKMDVVTSKRREAELILAAIYQTTCWETRKLESERT